MLVLWWRSRYTASMLGITMTQLKLITSLLFLRDSFDDFDLAEARFVTEFSAEFDGRIPEEGENSAYIKWGKLRPLAFQLIRGETLPKSFSLVLVYSREKTRDLLLSADRETPDSELPALFLNIRYRQEQMMLTTGISEKSFYPDFELPRLWDRAVLNLLSDLGLEEAISRP